MANMTEIICACGCGRKKQVRTADVQRGWGRFHSKRCKAIDQERRTKQYRPREHDWHDKAMSAQELSDRGY